MKTTSDLFQNVNISAIDKDVTVSRDDIMFSLHGPGSEFFTIRSRTGEVSVSQFGYGLIDRESTEQYRLRVGDHFLERVNGGE